MTDKELFEALLAGKKVRDCRYRYLYLAENGVLVDLDGNRASLGYSRRYKIYEEKKIPSFI